MLSIDNKSFRNKMKKYGKQMNVLVSFDDTTIDRTYVKKLEPSVNGELFTSIMRQLTIEVEKAEVIDSEKIYTVKKVHESTVDAVDNLRVKFLATDLNTCYTVDEVDNMLAGIMTETKVRHFVDRDAIQDIINASKINIKVGVRISEDEEYEYIDYGEFVVYDKEDKVDTHSIKLYLYDHLIDTHINYDDEPLQLDFQSGKITVLKLLQAICDKFGFTLKTTNFANANKIIPEDKYTGLDYIYRDILDEIAEVSGGFIKIFNKDLYVAYPTDTGETIDENDLEKLTIGEKNGEYNSLVLGRSPQEDNIYYPSNMKDEDRISIRIDNNQIMDKNREDYIAEIYNKVKGLEYYSFEFTSFGFGYFEFGDIVTLKDLDGNEYKAIMLNITETIDSGIKGKNYAEKTDYAETKYEYATGIEKRLINTEIICNKQGNQIKMIIEQQGETETKINSFTMDLEKTKSEIKNFEDSTNTKMSSFEQTAESLSGEIQNVKTEMKNDYYTKTQTDSKIEAKAGEITLSVGQSIETAKEEAISSANSNTDIKLKNYSTTTQMNSAIDLKFNEITLNVSKTYSTKEEVTQAKNDAISSANSSTDEKLSSYSTTKEMNAAIKLQIDAINLEVSETYTTKTEFKSGMSTTKSEAISSAVNSANASTDNKLKSYSTTTEMNSAIKLKTDAITLEVNKKLNESDFGTKLQLSSNDVRIAWNNISKYIQFANGELSIYDSAVSSTQKLRAKFNYNGNHFYRDDYYVGKIGTNQWASDNSHKGLVFDLDYQGKYMAFSQLESSSSSTYNTMLCFSRANSIYNEYGLHAGCDFYGHGNTLSGFKIGSIVAGGYNAYTGAIPIVTRIESGENGSFTWWHSTLRVYNGLIVGYWND